MLGVLMVTGDIVICMMMLKSSRKNAFSMSDVNLLSTLATSMGVALESARLFDETQRLFQAEQQRAAELAIINSVQQGLASNLEMQAIYNLVGDKIRDVFDAQGVVIALADSLANRIQFAYYRFRGERI